MLPWNRDCQGILLSDLAPARAEYEGFCPFLPQRESFTRSMGKIREATLSRYRKQGRNEAREQAGLEIIPKNIDDLPEDERNAIVYRVLVDECEFEERGGRREDPRNPGMFLSSLLLLPRSVRYENAVKPMRTYFLTQTGPIQPMLGPIAIEFELVYPNEEDRLKGCAWWSGSWNPSWDLDNFLKPVLDAMDPRMWTKDHKRAGLLPNDELVVSIAVSKREHVTGEEGPGFYWRIKSLAEGNVDGEDPVDE